MRILSSTTFGIFVSAILMSSSPAEESKRIWLDEGRAVVAESAPASVKKLVWAANRIVGKPYKTGGGHGVHEDTGYDCSGAVSYVLREAGYLKHAMSSRDFLTYGKAGEGEWITIWARAGHVFIEVAGLRFDSLGHEANAGPLWYEKKRSKAKFIPRQPN